MRGEWLGYIEIGRAFFGQGSKERGYGSHFAALKGEIQISGMICPAPRCGIFGLNKHGKRLPGLPKRYKLGMSETEGKLVWIDCEMTGLSPETDRIIEIACIVTDMGLDEIHEGPHLIIHQPKELLDGMDEW